MTAIINPIIPVNRRLPCDVCGSTVFEVTERIYEDKHTKIIAHNEKCADCGNLLYGLMKPLDVRKTPERGRFR